MTFDRKSYSKQYYQDNKDAFKERDRRRRSLLQKIVLEIKSFTPCMDCGVQYPAYVMQFDHRPGERKLHHIADIGSFGSPSALLKEINKCDVVCANCHATRTYVRLQDE